MLKAIQTTSFRVIVILLIASLSQLVGISAPQDASAAAQTRTLSTGIADSTGAKGLKWRQVDFTAAQTGTATFKLTWTGAANLRFQVHHSPSGLIGGNITAGGSPKTFSTSLVKNSAYHVAVWAYSGVGNYTLTLTENFPDDTSAPSIPQGLTSPSQTATSIGLTWNASTDNVGVTGYRVYRNGVLVGSPTANSYTDSGLTPSTTYTYTVRAVDKAGNASEPSTSLDAATTSGPGPQTQPNIIVINTDDQRADTLQYLPKIKQWLMDAGTTFTNGYVSTPSCCPSRATLMSGRYVHNNGQFGQLVRPGVDLNLMTQRYLHDAGYFTGHSGKFIHWVPLGDTAPYFDRWTYFKGGYDNVWMNFDGVTRQSQGYSTTITFDKAIDYLNDFEQRDDSKPFYMQLTPVAPHSPSTPEAAHANDTVPPMVLSPAQTETDRSDKPPFVRSRNNTVASVQASRTAMIRTLKSVDDQVDRLMRELEAKGELDNTMVIYTSDNGSLWGEHNLNSKFLPYTESVKVPFVIRWPGHVAANAIDNRFVTHIDVLPTILAATGVTQNQVVLDGKDILSGYDRPQAFTEFFYDDRNSTTIPTWAAIQTKEYYYAEYYGKTPSTTGVTFREYYDMVNDPYQLQNLLGDSSTTNDPSNIAQLSAELTAAESCVGSACQ
jgi:arylsulfatase A-like enzyme